jgi:hypothetical protein
MSALAELIQAADNLCNSIERISQQEASQSEKIAYDIAKISWEMTYTRNNLKKLSEKMETRHENERISTVFI